MGGEADGARLKGAGLLVLLDEPPFGPVPFDEDDHGEDSLLKSRERPCASRLVKADPESGFQLWWAPELNPLETSPPVTRLLGSHGMKEKIEESTCSRSDHPVLVFVCQVKRKHLERPVPERDSRDEGDAIFVLMVVRERASHVNCVKVLPWLLARPAKARPQSGVKGVSDGGNLEVEGAVVGEVLEREVGGERHDGRSGEKGVEGALKDEGLAAGEIGRFEDATWTSKEIVQTSVPAWPFQDKDAGRHLQERSWRPGFWAHQSSA